MFFQRKKRILIDLEKSFGAVKTEGFNFDLIKRYHDHKDHSNSFQVISDQTAHDLDLDLFFCYADRTSSKIGQQYLYDKLRTIDYSPDEFTEQEKILSHLSEHEEDRLLIQYELQKLRHQQAYYVVDLFQQKIDQKAKWYFIIPILSMLSAASIICSFFNPTFIFILFGLIPIHLLIHYGLKRKTNLFINSIPALLTLGAVAKNLSKFQVFSSNRQINHSIQVISSIRRKMSFFRLEQKIDSDMEAAYWFLIELVKILFLLEPLLLFSSLDKLRDKSKEIEDVYRFVGHIDAIISISSLREGLDGYSIPVIDDAFSSVSFTGLKHPLVPDCIPNSISTQMSVLLTGSNMSGKTTFIRSIGLNYLSGITMNTCFANSARLPIAKLFSVIRIEDDLIHASSYFFKEVDAIKEIILATEKKENTLILLDELFKGTNTIERIASAKATLSHLATEKNQVFVSTHDVELTKMLENQFDLFYFSESIVDSSIHFDHLLKKGVPGHGNAIRILDINGYPKTIIDEAQSLISAMKTP